jgi:hypothetical protein
VEGSCEHCIELSGSIECWEVLEWLHIWQLLKKGSAPQVSNVGGAVLSPEILVKFNPTRLHGIT